MSRFRSALTCVLALAALAVGEDAARAEAGIGWRVQIQAAGTRPE